MNTKRITVISAIIVVLLLSFFVTDGFAENNFSDLGRTIEQRISELEGLYADIVQWLTGHQGKIETLEEKVEQNERNISYLYESLESQSEYTNYLEHRLNSQQNEINELTQQLRTACSEIRNIKERLGEAEQPPACSNLSVLVTVNYPDGTPAKDTFVKIAGVGGSVSTFTDSQGSVEMNFKSSYNFTTAIAEKDYFVAIHPNITFNPDSQTELNLVLTEAGKISGQVNLGEGVQSDWMVVILTDATGTVLNLAHVEADGTYTLNAPAGTYDLLLRLNDGREILEEITVINNQSVIKDFLLTE